MGASPWWTDRGPNGSQAPWAGRARSRGRGSETLIMTTPSLHGRSFGANAVEAAAPLTGRPPEEMGLDAESR